MFLIAHMVLSAVRQPVIKSAGRGLPVYGQTRVQGVSFNDELGQVLVEISDGQTLALADVKRISE